MDEQELLHAGIAFHGHKCWAMPTGLRAGLAALRALGAQRTGAKALHAIVEIGEYHGAMCFGDGVQVATGCTFGKGNIAKAGYGKLAVTLVDKHSNRAARVAFRPKLMPQIKDSAFMRKRAAGVPPTEIPDEDAQAVVELVWNAPEGDLLSVGQRFDYAWSEPTEAVRFVTCEQCGEAVAEPYARMAEGKLLCVPCCGYGR
jgi:formylmethanofuran dehydrogenase subunit E